MKWIADEAWPDGRRWVLVSEDGKHCGRIMRFRTDDRWFVESFNSDDNEGETSHYTSKDAAISLMKRVGMWVMK